MSDAGFFKGTSTEQDSRFSNAQKKMMKTMRFADGLDTKIDMSKVNLDVIKPWIAKRMLEILDVDDDVVIDFAMNQLEEKHPDPKLMQINMTGFLGGQSARTFMGQLWKLLATAQESTDGIPPELLELKMQELKDQQEADEKLKEKIRQKEEEIRKAVLRQGDSTDQDGENEKRRDRHSRSFSPANNENNNVIGNSRSRRNSGSYDRKRSSRKRSRSASERRRRRNSPSSRRHHSSSVESYQRQSRRREGSRHRYHSPPGYGRIRYPPPPLPPHHNYGSGNYRSRRYPPSPRHRTPPHMSRYYHRRRSPRDISRRRRRSSSGSRRRRSPSYFGNGRDHENRYRDSRRDRKRTTKSASVSSGTSSRSSSSKSGCTSEEDRTKPKTKEVPVQNDRKSKEKSSSEEDEPPLKKIIAQEKSARDFSKQPVLIIPKEKNIEKPDPVKRRSRHNSYQESDASRNSSASPHLIKQSPSRIIVRNQSKIAGSGDENRNLHRSNSSQDKKNTVSGYRRPTSSPVQQPRRAIQRYDPSPHYDRRGSPNNRHTKRRTRTRSDSRGRRDIGQNRQQRQLQNERQDQMINIRERGKRDDYHSRDERSKRRRNDSDLHRMHNKDGRDSSVEDSTKEANRPGLRMEHSSGGSINRKERRVAEFQQRERVVRRKDSERDGAIPSSGGGDIYQQSRRIRSRERRVSSYDAKEVEPKKLDENDDDKAAKHDSLPDGKHRKRKRKSRSSSTSKRKHHIRNKHDSAESGDEDVEKHHRKDEDRTSKKSKKSKKRKSKHKSKKSKKSRRDTSTDSSSSSSADEVNEKHKRKSKKSSKHRKNKRKSTKKPDDVSRSSDDAAALAEINTVGNNNAVAEDSSSRDWSPNERISNSIGDQAALDTEFTDNEKVLREEALKSMKYSHHQPSSSKQRRASSSSVDRSRANSINSGDGCGVDEN
ncbi:hypothetical protein GJ496_008518 [Pomphorhynchus laevis]|nr:hypothetical protein GJ496_008518 [Pomphorhynchus laevis]